MGGITQNTCVSVLIAISQHNNAIIDVFSPKQPSDRVSQECLVYLVSGPAAKRLF